MGMMTMIKYFNAKYYINLKIPTQYGFLTFEKAARKAKKKKTPSKHNKSNSNISRHWKRTWNGLSAGYSSVVVMSIVRLKLLFFILA